MNTASFPFEKFLAYKEEKRNTFLKFIQDASPKPLVISQPDSTHWTGSGCVSKERSLEAQLAYLKACMETESDLAFTYLEPWYGVGVYAAAYGCDYIFAGDEPPQTRPIFASVDDLQGIPKPHIKDCQVMNHVLDMIRYFKDQVGDYIDISLTDTQSTNDTASLILDPCELFVASISDMESIDPFLTQITELIEEFSERQMELIGGNLALPGHIMLCDRKLGGIAVSDDNMAFISPQAYDNSIFPYNERLSRHFGGISIHTCGNASANLKRMAQTPNLFMVDLALGTAVDPMPNRQDAVIEAFSGSDVIVKVKVGDQELDKISDILKSDMKTIVELRMSCGSTDERNRRFEKAKQTIEEMAKA